MANGAELAVRKVTNGENRIDFFSFGNNYFQGIELTDLGSGMGRIKRTQKGDPILEVVFAARRKANRSEISQIR